MREALRSSQIFIFYLCFCVRCLNFSSVNGEKFSAIARRGKWYVRKRTHASTGPLPQSGTDPIERECLHCVFGSYCVTVKYFVDR